MNIPSGDWGAQFRWSFDDAQAQEALYRFQGAMRALDLVYDNDGLWDWGDPQVEGSQTIQRMVDQYAQVGARALVWGCGNNLAWSYPPPGCRRPGATGCPGTRSTWPSWPGASASGSTPAPIP